MCHAGEYSPSSSSASSEGRNLQRPQPSSELHYPPCVLKLHLLLPNHVRVASGVQRRDGRIEALQAAVVDDPRR